MEEILTIQKSIIFDESIANYETHTHQPFASSTFNNNDEIRIAVQHQDLCLLQSRSSLHVDGRSIRVDGVTPTDTTQLVNNAICHLFDEIRYEFNAIEIDRCKNVGLMTVMKNYISQSPVRNLCLRMLAGLTIMIGLLIKMVISTVAYH